MKKTIALLLVLAACAPAPMVDLRSTLSRSTIDRSTRPLILAEIPTRALAATMEPRGERAGVTTWRTGQDQTLAFRDGVLVATRGLGLDLMSADVSGTIAALNGGPQTGYSRLMTYLDGEGGTVFRAMLCEMGAPRSATVDSIGLAFATTLRVETCHTTGQSVTNRYWTDPDGTMRRSEQWIGPGLDMLATERLTR